MPSSSNCRRAENYKPNDGRTIRCCLQIRQGDKKRDKKDIGAIDSPPGLERSLVEGSNARWSPTGDRLAYLAQGKPKGTQILVRYMDAEGAITQITHVGC
jgi:hypothetical protein